MIPAAPSRDPLVNGPRRQPVMAVPPEPVTAPVRRLEGTGLLFAGFLVLVALEYLLAPRFPILKVTKIATVVAYGVFAAVILKTGLKGITEYPQSRLLVAFVVFTAASVMWAVVRSMVPPQVRYHLDYFGLFLMALYLVDRPSRIDKVAVLFVTIMIALVVQNAEKLQSSVRLGDFRAAYFMGDGNDFAWGLNTMLPCALYLLLGRRGFMTRLLGLGGVAAGVVGIAGTQSRGAAIAFAVGLMMLWLTVVKRKVLGLVTVLILAVASFVVAPSGYVDRLKTVSDYEEDSSAQGRLRAWGAAARMAVDYPLGVGANNFNRAYGRFYIPDDPQGYMAYRWISPHSVYFRVLAEYGFIGLGMLLAIIALNIRDNRRTVRRIRASPQTYAVSAIWPALVNVGFVMYCVGAIFLGGFSYPHLYLLTGLTLGCRRMADVDEADRGATERKPEVVPPAQALARPPARSAVPARRGKPARVPSRFF